MIESKAFTQRIKQMFCENLLDVQEDYPNMEYYKQINTAAEMTAESLSDIAFGIAENHKARHIEAVNKFHFC